MVLKERDYSLGKIYRIYSDICNIVYIGSTTERYLCNRKKTHKYKFRKWDQDPNKYSWTSSFDLLRLPYYEFDLIESYPCDNIDELQKRERYWMEKFRENPKLVVVNRNTPCLTDQERRDSKRESYHRTKIHCKCECGGCYTMPGSGWTEHTRTKRHKDHLDKEEKNLNIL